MVSEHDECAHEELIQNQSRKIAELETRADSEFPVPTGEEHVVSGHKPR